jgi:PAS domain S-box-containing protein
MTSHDLGYPSDDDVVPEIPLEVLQAVAAPVLVLDAQTRILWLNEAAANLTGFSVSEIQGTSLWERLGVRDERHREAERLRVLYEPGSTQATCTLVLRTKAGGRRRVHWMSRWISGPGRGRPYLVMTGSRAGLSPSDRNADEDDVESRRALLDSLRDQALFRLDIKGHVASWNAAAERVYGYSADEILDRPIAVFRLGEDAAAGRPEQELRAASRDGRIETDGWRLRGDGSRFWANVVLTALYDEAGRTTGFAELIRDITEKKQAEDMLTRLGRILDDSLNEIFVFDAHTLRFLQVNRGACRNLGYSKEEMRTLTVPDIKPEFDRQSFMALVAPLSSGVKERLEFTTVHKRKDGSLYPVEVHLQLLPADAQPVFVAITVDLTERRRVEAALRETESRWLSLFEAAPEFIFFLDLDARIMLTNPYTSRQTGYAERELVGSYLGDFFTDRSRELFAREHCVLRDEGISHGDIEFVCKDGRVLNVACEGTAVRDRDGNIAYFLVFQRDITDRMRAVAALEASERRFRAIFNSTFQFIGLLSPDGIVLEVNQTALDFGGLRDEDVVGRPFWEANWWSLSSETQNRLKVAIWQAAGGELVRYEVDVLGKEGAVATIDFSLKPVVNAEGKTVLIIPEGRDITERKSAEEEAKRHQQELAHFTRLSTMGEMASSMAHELNQPLMAVASYCETALGALAQPVPQLTKVRELLGRAVKQAHRAGEIIRRLRAFLVKGTGRKELFDVDEVVREVVHFLESELRLSQVKVELRLGGRGCPVRADKVQIEQVLLNLVRNSLEAIQETRIPGARIAVETKLVANHRIHVRVVDNGPGIDAAIYPKLFDPFQTSKGGGMGMGLAISRSIIEAHGGKLWAGEASREGAVFGFELDCTAKGKGN